MGIIFHLTFNQRRPFIITKMRFFILTLLVASAMAQQQNTQWTKEQYDQWQEAQARQGFGSSSDLFIPESRQLGTTLFNRTYIQGLATTFLLIFGLISLLD